MRRAIAMCLVLAVACQQPPTVSTPPPAAQDARCGQRIERDLVLASDLECDGDALVVVADDVTIDLGGRLIRGPGMGPQTWPSPQLDSVGVRAEGRHGIRLRNGRINGFSTGVYFVNVTGSMIEDITSERSRFGIYMHDSDRNTVRDSTCEGNVYGLHLQRANDNVIEGNRLVRQTYNSPGGYGIYLYDSQRNRIVGNDIERNINWGLWFSEARDNLVYHNNVAGNQPQVSDSSQGNQWWDPERKEGNHWGDYSGRDGDGDGIGDTPYPILGAGQTVDAYPFVERDGWTKKQGATIDHYRPAQPRERREVRVVAVAGGSVVLASPGGGETLGGPPAQDIAIGPDGRTVYALAGRRLTSVDAATGAVSAPLDVGVDATSVAANRDGRSVFVVGPRAAEQVPLAGGARVSFGYEGAPTAVVPSFKYNQMFVATHDGIDMMYIQTGWSGDDYSRGGHVPYTVRLGGAPVDMVMNWSGTRLYVAVAGVPAIQVVDTEQLAVVATLPGGEGARALALDARESRLYVATADGLAAVDLGARVVARRVPLPGRAVDVAASPNGDEVYVALGGDRLGIAVLSAGDLAPRDLIDLSAAPTRLLVATY